MRGKSDRPEASPSPVKDFPTVMVARSDYSDLSRALAWMQMQKQEAQLEIIVSNVPMILNSEYMGNFDYPKISLSDKLVIVQSNAPWGVVLSLTQSQVWQLFILPKTDVNTLSPFKMRTANGHEVSMNPQMSANRVEWYSQYLRQKCNNNIAVSSTGTVSMKRPRKTSSRSR